MPSVILLPNGFQPEYETGVANGLARNGWTVTLVGSDMSLPDRLDAGVRLLNLRGSQDPGRLRWRKALNLVRYWLRCYSYLGRHRGTPVHVIGKFSTPNLRLSLIEAWLTRLVARRYVLTVHELLPHDDRSTRAFRLSRAIYRTAAVCTTHTRPMRDALASDFGFDPAKIVLIEHGIDRVLGPSPESRQQMRNRLGANPEDALLLFFGNLAPYKGVDVLLDAFDRLTPGLSARLVIAGRCRENALSQTVRARIDASPNRATIAWLEGYVPEDDVAPLFHAADVLVMPYRDIGQSGVVFMALATGLRVVASDVGALREYIPAELGTVVPPDDPEALAGGIEAVLTRVEPISDPSALASHYLWSSTVQPLLPIYLTLVDG